MHVTHAWRVNIILYHRDAPLSHIHAEARLNLDNYENILCREVPAPKVGSLWVKSCGEVPLFASTLLTAAIAHLFV